MFKPSKNVILLEESKTENKTDSGLILAGSSNQSPRGIVKYIEDATAQETGLSAGDEVLYQPFGAFPVQLGAESLLAVSSSDVLGVLTGEVNHG